MGKFIFFFGLSLGVGVGSAFSKTFDPPHLELFAQVSQKGGELQVTLTGRTGPEFHLYSVFPQGEFGPEATRIILEQPPLKPLHPPEESKPKLLFDLALGENYLIHQGEFWVSQTYRLTPPLKTIKGYLFYQLCDNLICLMPTRQPFEVIIP